MCSICQTSIEEGDAITVCNSCQCQFHSECWQDNGGCAMPGCKNAPISLKKAGELPWERTFWGATNKICPSCGETIKVGELICPFCNESFDSVEPIRQEEFKDRLIGRTAEVPEKKIAVIIFICGLLGITAPFNLFLGGTWYFQKRKILHESSPLYNLLAVSGLLISIFYCIIFFLILIS